MSLDADSYPALWRLFDATGIRPEYILPVLWHESGFNPRAVNPSSGCVGINQLCSPGAYGFDAASYTALPASAQIDRGVIPYFSPYAGTLNSGARVYQAEFLPATLSKATGLDDVIASSGSAFYDQNPSLDPNRTGVISLRTLADVVAADAQNPHVQQAVANAYTVASGSAGPQQDSAYGTDFGNGVSTVSSLFSNRTLWVVGGVAAAGVLGALWWSGLSPREKRRIRRMLPA